MNFVLTIKYTHSIQNIQNTPLCDITTKRLPDNQRQTASLLD